jgi:hypothetical protein
MASENQLSVEEPEASREQASNVPKQTAYHRVVFKEKEIPE